MDSYIAPPEACVNPYTRNLGLIKGFFKRPLMLVIAILYSASIPLGILQINDIVSFILNAQPRATTAAELNTISTTFHIIGGAYFLLPVLTVVGFWIIYLKSRSASTVSSPNGGLTLLSVLTIIQMVLLGMLGLVLLIAFSMPATYTKNASGFMTASMRGVMAVCLCLTVLVLVVAYLFLISRLLFINSIKKSSRSMTLQKRGSLFFAVLMFISAFGRLMSLVDIIAYFPNNDSAKNSLPGGIQFSASPWMIVNLAVMAAASICLAILAISYHSYINRMNAEIYASTPPQYPTYANPYGQSPYVPQGGFQQPPFAQYPPQQQPLNPPYPSYSPYPPYPPQPPQQPQQYRQPEDNKTAVQFSNPYAPSQPDFPAEENGPSTAESDYKEQAHTEQCDDENTPPAPMP